MFIIIERINLLNYFSSLLNLIPSLITFAIKNILYIINANVAGNNNIIIDKATSIWLFSTLITPKETNTPKHNNNCITTILKYLFKK